MLIFPQNKWNDTCSVTPMENDKWIWSKRFPSIHQKWCSIEGFRTMCTASGLVNPRSKCSSIWSTSKSNGASCGEYSFLSDDKMLSASLSGSYQFYLKLLLDQIATFILCRMASVVWIDFMEGTFLIGVVEDNGKIWWAFCQPYLALAIKQMFIWPFSIMEQRRLTDFQLGSKVK